MNIKDASPTFFFYGISCCIMIVFTHLLAMSSAEPSFLIKKIHVTMLTLKIDTTKLNQIKITDKT